MRYFQKIYPSQPLVLSNGKGFMFPILASGVGAHATENPILLKEFDLAIAQKIGGVREISAAEFEALKKKAPLKPLNEAISPSKLLQVKQSADRAAAERAAKGRPLNPIVSKSFKKPDSPAQPRDASTPAPTARAP